MVTSAVLRVDVDGDSGVSEISIWEGDNAFDLVWQLWVWLFVIRRVAVRRRVAVSRWVAVSRRVSVSRWLVDWELFAVVFQRNGHSLAVPDPFSSILVYPLGELI